MDAVAQLTAALAGRYAIDREIGRGGMATVFLAEDLKHRRPVAIKLLHAELGAWLGAERFLHEIRITARLQHPNILPLLDSGDADGALYYVMPYVAGETLRARLQRERPRWHRYGVPPADWACARGTRVQSLPSVSRGCDAPRARD